MNRIIFKNPDNSISIVIPAPNVLKQRGLQAIAKKDVPAGLPYNMINDTDIPSDRTNRDAWEWDDTITPDGYGGESNDFD